MRATNRIIAIVVICVILVLMSLSVFIGITSYAMASNAKAKVNRTLARIAASNRITSMEYNLLTDELYQMDYSGETTVSAVYYEKGTDSKDHLCAITWGEIRESLSTIGFFELPPGAFVKIGVHSFNWNFNYLLRLFDFRNDFSSTIQLLEDEV